MNQHVHMSIDKFMILLQQQRPPKCNCVDETSELYITQQAFQGAGSRFDVQCTTCSARYIYSTGDQWLDIPVAKTHRQYIKELSMQVAGCV